MMGASSWIPAMIIAAVLLAPFLLMRWIPQLAGNAAGDRVKAAMVIVGVCALCLLTLEAFLAHRSVCLASSSDLEFRCEISSTMIVAVISWFGVAALSQIRFVIASLKGIVKQNRED